MKHGDACVSGNNQDLLQDRPFALTIDVQLPSHAHWTSHAQLDLHHFRLQSKLRLQGEDCLVRRDSWFLLLSSQRAYHCATYNTH